MKKKENKIVDGEIELNGMDDSGVDAEAAVVPTLFAGSESESDCRGNRNENSARPCFEKGEAHEIGIA